MERTIPGEQGEQRKYDDPLHTMLVNTLYDQPHMAGFYDVSQPMKELEFDDGSQDPKSFDLAFLCNIHSEPILVECKTGITSGVRKKAIRKVEAHARKFMGINNLESCKLAVCMFNQTGKMAKYSARLVLTEKGIDYIRNSENGHAWEENQFDVPDELLELYQLKYNRTLN